MSGWLASFPNRLCCVRPASRLGLFATGMLFAVLTVGSLTAQPPPPDNPADAVDDRPPLPSGEPKRAILAAKYRIPNQDRAIFAGRPDKYGGRTGGIQDDEPVASEKQNPDEYNSWAEVVSHANQFSAEELERYAARDLTPDDLTYPSRKLFRLDLIGFDGKLVKVRRVRATKSLEETGLAEVFEGWIVPAGESPATPICAVFTTWPADLPALPQRAASQNTSPFVEMDRWVSFAGYSFKSMPCPLPEADATNPSDGKWSKAPLLVGRSITPLAKPPAEATQIALRTDLRIFKLIRDSAPMSRSQDSWEEAAAWNRVVLHAHRFTTEELEAKSRKDLTFADLFTETRSEYKLQLVTFEGRLIRLKKAESNKRLIEAGISDVYEGWLVPKAEPRGHPICIILTDLPPGLEPKPLMSKWVSFSGYSFKLLLYESGESRPDDPAKNIWKKAPLLIGRSIVLRDEENSVDVGSRWRNEFLPAVLCGLLVIVAAGLALGWLFRKGDRRAQEEIDAFRHQNPFRDRTM